MTWQSVDQFKLNLTLDGSGQKTQNKLKHQSKTENNQNWEGIQTLQKSTSCRKIISKRIRSICFDNRQWTWLFLQANFSVVQLSCNLKPVGAIWELFLASWTVESHSWLRIQIIVRSHDLCGNKHHASVEWISLTWGALAFTIGTISCWQFRHYSLKARAQISHRSTFNL